MTRLDLTNVVDTRVTDFASVTQEGLMRSVDAS
jgi:hypothetical protein